MQNLKVRSQTNKVLKNQVICGDALELLDELEDNSIDAVLTDPPYFLDRLGSDWNVKKVHNQKNLKVVQSLPAGMKFDREQGQQLYKWYLQISKKLFRVLKTGGFFFSFSSPRLYHRLACAVDDAGFEIRDCFIWLYTQNQAKAMSLNHFIDKLDIAEREKVQLKNQLEGWKTPQLKSCFEPIVVAQKPVDQTYLNNMINHQVGLLNSHAKTHQKMFPSNVMSTDEICDLIDKTFLVSKPTAKEKGTYNHHKTVKPLDLCKHLLNLSVFHQDAVVLDPFAGSGTTLVASKELGFNYVGFELNQAYVDITQKRLKSLDVEESPLFQSHASNT